MLYGYVPKSSPLRNAKEKNFVFPFVFCTLIRNFADMIDYQAVIDYFYGTEDTELRRILMAHSRAVADKALRICDRHPELGMDREFVEAAAMLHDIGIIQCDAPGIHCHGTRPYIQHGIAGVEMLRLSPPSFPTREGQGGESALLERLARVCSHHTGAGITRAEVVAQGLPLPLPDDDSEPYLPETLEEKVICYADKFFSKTRPSEEKTFEQAERSLMKFGEAGVARFREWHRLFESPK